MIDCLNHNPHATTHTWTHAIIRVATTKKIQQLLMQQKSNTITQYSLYITCTCDRGVQRMYTQQHSTHSTYTYIILYTCSTVFMSIATVYIYVSRVYHMWHMSVTECTLRGMLM